MTEWTAGLQFIHRVPAFIMHEFYAVMDSLDSADWSRFASYIVSDVTELRLLGNRGDLGRTENVMWYWMNRNGTVGQLVDILTSLKLWRARDIILSWKPPVHPPQPYVAPARVNRSLPAPEPSPSTTPLPARSNVEESFNGKLSEKETVTIDSPVLKNELPRPPTPPDSLFTDPGKDPPASHPVSPPPVRKDVFYWPLCELRNGTRDFAEEQKIGEGGFGCVYHAVMRHTEYAVKRLKEDSDLDWKTVRESFYTELEKLYQYRHPNVVDLAGCCVEDGFYCLVYTYMPNGSLQDRLHCRDGTAPLSWLRRLNVLLGAARAIQFLHCSNPSLIHGDVKSSNILLDENFVPKLGDFGLARFSRYSNNSGTSCTVARTRTLCGTLAYLPDEYIMIGKLAVELDTYSFGVVLLEILTGRKALENEGSAKSKYLKDIIKEEEKVEEKEESAGRTDSTIARRQRVAVRVCQTHVDKSVWAGTRDVPLQLCLLASECLNHKRKRPKMTKVYEKLEELRQALRWPTSPEAPPLSEGSEGERSATELAERLQRSSLSPVENTYRFAINSGARRPGSDPLLSCANSCSSLKALGRECRTPGHPGGSGPGSSSSGGLCRPVESEESSTDHGGGGPYWTLGTVARQKAASHCPPLQTDSPYQSLSSLPGLPQHPVPEHPHATFLSADSQALSSPSRQIVLNPAKQKILQQFALYNAGQINSSELLSSMPGQESWSARRTPEESDEFD